MGMVMKFYRLARVLHLKKVPFLSKLIWVFMRIIFSCDIPYTANIHRSTKLGHNGLGIVIHPNATIGENSIIMHQVTIGGNHGKVRIHNGKEFGFPIIGDNVFIGPGAKIMGPVFIGNNVIIGANAIVTKDCEANGLYAGIPAKRLKDIPNQNPNNNLHYVN